MALTLTVKEVLFLRSLYEEFHKPPKEPTPVFCDNQAAVTISKDPVSSSRTRHVSTYFHWVRDQQKNKLVAVISISTKQQAADFLTKMLPTKDFYANCALIGQVLVEPEEDADLTAAAPKEGKCCKASCTYGRCTMALSQSFVHSAARQFKATQPGLTLQKRVAVLGIAIARGKPKSRRHGHVCLATAYRCIG